MVLVERRHEFRKGLRVAYVDLKKVDSVHCEALWELLRLRGTPAKITSLISESESAVMCGEGVSSFFIVNTGVRPECVSAAISFQHVWTGYLARL